jgi:hypothetical protein
MDDRDWLAQRFDAERPHLIAVAYRMLGSAPKPRTLCRRLGPSQPSRRERGGQSRRMADEAEGKRVVTAIEPTAQASLAPEMIRGLFAVASLDATRFLVVAQPRIPGASE